MAQTVYANNTRPQHSFAAFQGIIWETCTGVLNTWYTYKVDRILQIMIISTMYNGVSKFLPYTVPNSVKLQLDIEHSMQHFASSNKTRRCMNYVSLDSYDSTGNFTDLLAQGVHL